MSEITIQSYQNDPSLLIWQYPAAYNLRSVQCTWRSCERLIHTSSARRMDIIMQLSDADYNMMIFPWFDSLAGSLPGKIGLLVFVSSVLFTPERVAAVQRACWPLNEFSLFAGSVGEAIDLIYGVRQAVSAPALRYVFGAPDYAAHYSY